MRADGRMDRYDEASLVAFRNFANASKNADENVHNNSKHDRQRKYDVTRNT
jgi:hypothetical protein